MRAFIIRPFGTKNDINFDEVEEKLIDPALNNLQITGRTTMEIRRQGNIRVDMFQRLLTADLVIADISIHNANVYYELGVRHALRGKRTFLIRARGADIKTDEVPFDIKTDRYLSYDGADPSAGVPDLVAGLRQTINSESPDSPVFQMLPELEEQDRSRFLPVPLGFREEVERATADQQAGDLELLAAEARGFEWEIEGLRLVGRAQFEQKAHEGSRATWELVRGHDPLDVEANTLLAIVYQRLGDLTKSDQAVRRALSRGGIEKYDRAELCSLIGSNAKAQWADSWCEAAEGNRREAALRSPFLEESFRAYAEGFDQDLNHYYSGLNALAMLSVENELAQSLPQVWAERFDDDEEARRELSARKKRAEKLASAVELSLAACRNRLEKEGKSDIWADISVADLYCLTLKRPARVADEYRRALATRHPFAVDSAQSQLSRYQKLGVFADNVAAALEAVNLIAPAAEDKQAAGAPRRVLLFTGHMIDAPGREEPRFPNEPEKIDAAKRKIAEAVEAERAVAGGIAYGMAGCASGGDILFLQVCEAAGIQSRILLAMPREQYIKASVEHAGPEWVEEFNRLVGSHPVRVLGESKELPAWLQSKPGYTIWQRNNLWTLYNALAVGGDNVTLIALWDGAGSGDGPGGTADMVEKARARGAKTVILDTKKIFAP